MLDVSMGRTSAHLVPGALLVILVVGTQALLVGAVPDVNALGIAGTFVLVAVSYVAGQVLGVMGFVIDRHRWRRGTMWQARHLDDGFPLPPVARQRLEALFAARFAGVAEPGRRSPEAQLTLFKVVEDHVALRGSRHGSSARNQFLVFRGVTLAFFAAFVLNLFLYAGALGRFAPSGAVLATGTWLAPLGLGVACLSALGHFERQHVLAVYESLLAVESVAAAERMGTTPQATP